MKTEHDGNLIAKIKLETGKHITSCSEMEIDKVFNTVVNPVFCKKRAKEIRREILQRASDCEIRRGFS